MSRKGKSRSGPVSRGRTNVVTDANAECISDSTAATYADGTRLAANPEAASLRCKRSHFAHTLFAVAALALAACGGPDETTVEGPTYEQPEHGATRPHARSGPACVYNIEGRYQGRQYVAFFLADSSGQHGELRNADRRSIDSRR